MNRLRLSPTEDGRIKVRVVSPGERDLSAVVSFSDLQEAIRITQEGSEAEIELEHEAAADPSAPVSTAAEETAPAGADYVRSPVSEA